MTSPQPDAIIFIPGIADWLDQSVDGVARRIAVSLDRNAQSAGAKFNLKLESRDEEYLSSAPLHFTRKTRVRTIFRKDAGLESPVLDIYEMDYCTTLTRNYEQLNPLMQSVRLFLLLVLNLHRLVSAIRSPAKSRAAKGQFYVGLLIISLLIGYMVLLFITAGGIVGQAITQASHAIGSIVPQPAAASPADLPASPSFTLPAIPPELLNPGLLLGPLQGLVIFVAVAQTLSPNLRNGFMKGALTYTSVIEYITYGERREVIAGQFADLLEHIAEKGQYRRIHVIAYSFGSIVALDMLFPASRRPGERLKLLHTLVTIGCPFDLFRMFWPEYYKKRGCLPDWPPRWLNLYSPADVLASNFRDDDQEQPADKGLSLTEGGELKPENLLYRRGQNQVSPLAALVLSGLRAHTEYWEVEYESEVSCFTDIVLTMYTGDPLLQ